MRSTAASMLTNGFYSKRKTTKTISLSNSIYISIALFLVLKENIGQVGLLDLLVGQHPRNRKDSFPGNPGNEFYVQPQQNRS